MQGSNVSHMASECSIIYYFKTKNFKKNSGRGTAPLPPHTPSVPTAFQSSCLQHSPPFKNPRSAIGSCNGVGFSTDVSSVSWKMTLSGYCDSDLCSGSGCCLGRLPA